MNKYLLATFLASAMAAGASGEVKVTAVPVGEKPTIQPMKVQTGAEVLVYENFDKWTDGSVEEPNWDDPLTSYDAEEIDPALMNDDAQWTGYKVYQAGGVCAMRTFNPQQGARLSTPKGDYSGSVKVTFLAKYQRVEWTDEEGTTWHWSGAGVTMGLYTNDYKDFEVGEEDGLYYDLCSIRLYPNMGWYEVTVEFDNYTAYNDASLWFTCADGVLLDNIKVTSSVDKFIAAPIIDSVTDVTQTSFTINFQPVRKSSNYYTYLFELRGYNEETGEPIYMPIPNPEDYESYVDYFGISSYEEYWEMWSGVSQDKLNTPWYLNDPYCNYGKVEEGDPFSYTFSNLDPSKQYYYALASHYVLTFSPIEIYPMNQIAAPIAEMAADIKSDSFTAKWESVAKADTYKVNLYGVNKVVEDSDDFIIFEEDFENVSNYTDSDDIYDPGTVDSDSGLTMDDLTSTPGWETRIDHALLVHGMLGLDGANYWLYTPELYVAGSDKIRINLSCKFINEGLTFYLRFAGVTYQVQVKGDSFEDWIELPTRGVKTSKLQIDSPDYEQMFIDYIVISQSLKKGEYTYTYMGSNVTDATEWAYSDLDTDRFDMYGYSVISVKGEGKAEINSEESERIIVDLHNGNSFTGVKEIEVVNDNAEVTEVARYTIDGKRIDAPAKGLNIVRMSDGSVRKVMVR